MEDRPALLDYDNGSAYLGGVSRAKMKDLAARGLIKKVRVGRRAMFTRASLDRYIASIEKDAA